MQIENYIRLILEEQAKRNHKLPSDLIIKNGNITLRSFNIISYNAISQSIKGLTLQEEYCHLRENRPPVYCYFNLSEIKALQCPLLELELVGAC